MNNLLCLIGLHKWEGKNKPSLDGGMLYWDKCLRCDKETEKDCIHGFGPFEFTIHNQSK